jgi:hypothetical protein
MAVAVLGLAVACSPDTASDGEPEPTPSPGEPGQPQWEPRAGLSVPRDDFASAVVGEEIWTFGGLTGDRGNRLESIEVYNTRTDRWRVSRLTLPEGLASFEGTAIGDRIFLFGGLDVNTEASDFAAVLDTSTGQWRRLPPLPSPRYAHSVTLHEGLIYVIGGEGAAGVIDTVDVYDPAERTWSTGAAMPEARGSHDAVSAGDIMYVLGGYLDGGPTDLVQTYDPATGKWAVAEPLPEPVSRAGVAVLDDRLWVSLHEFSYVLDVGGRTWSPAPPLTVPRHGLGYLPVDGSIFGIGGCTESPLRDVRSVDELQVL